MEAEEALAKLDKSASPMCPECVKAVKDGTTYDATCKRCETMRQKAVEVEVKIIDPVTGQENDPEDQRPKLVDEILTEIAEEDEKREERWQLEDALRMSLNSIDEYASDAERAGLIEQTVTQFATRMSALKGLLEMELLAKQLFPGTTKAEGDVPPAEPADGAPALQGFGVPEVDTAMAALHGVVTEALTMTDPQEKANALKAGLEALAVVVMEANAAAEPEPHTGPERSRQRRAARAADGRRGRAGEGGRGQTRQCALL